MSKTLARQKYTNVKPHRESVLGLLTDEQRQELHNWLKTSMTYMDICKRMKIQWGLTTWPTTISKYYHRFVAAQLLQQREKSLGVADEISKALLKNPGKFHKAIFDLVARKYFDLLRDEEVHPKIVEIFGQQYTRLLDQETRQKMNRLKARRITLLEKQAEAARETAFDSKLTAEQKQERIFEIFKRPLPPDDKPNTNGSSIAA